MVAEIEMGTVAIRRSFCQVGKENEGSL